MGLFRWIAVFLAAALTLGTPCGSAISLCGRVLGVEESGIADGDPLRGFDGLNPQQDWPWWRGPNRNGVAANARVPVRFGSSENVLWKTSIPGRGHGSPIVVGGRVFVPTADEERQIHAVVAYELETGKALWQTEVSRGGFPEENHAKNTEASITIACDGKRLFVNFFHHRQIHLTSLDLEGEIQWSRAIGPFNPQVFKYGYAPSPVLYKQSVILVGEFDGTSWITAVARKNGKQLWRSPRPKNVSFSTPVVAHIAGRDQLLLSGAERVASYDPNNGRMLWNVVGTTGATCGTMVWQGNLVFASGGYPKAETLAVAADGSRQVVWRNNQKCYEQSMIVVQGYLYGLTDKGVLYCWRAVDGKEMWRERLKGPVSASPILANGHIYWANESGTVYVFRPDGSKFDLVAENRLGSEAFASPAVAGNRLLFRVAQRDSTGRQEVLVCVGEE